MKLLHPEVEIVPGKPGNRPAASPVPEKQSIPGSAVVRLTNTTPQENAYTIRLRCGESFWQEAWYTVAALMPTEANAPTGGKPDQRGPQDRWVKVYVPRGGSRDILIRFNVPQRPESRAGRYEYAVEIETQIIGAADGGRRSERVRALPAVALVRPYYKWGVDLSPEQKQVNRVRRSGEFDVVVTNEGNDWLYCDLQLPRPKDMTVECYTLRLAVPPPEPGELLPAESGTEERPGTSRSIPLRAATKLKTVRGDLTAQNLLVSAVRVDAPSVPLASPETGSTEGAVVATPTTEAKPLSGPRALVYAPPIPAKLTDFFSRSAGSIRTLVMSLVGLVLVAHMSVLLYQRYAYDAISVEPYNGNADPGKPLKIRGQFLQGAQLLMGTKTDGFTAVPSRPDPKNLSRVIITSVPAEFDHKSVQIKAQRFVGLFPILTPLLPSATSKGRVQVGSVVIAADPEVLRLAGGTLLPGKTFAVGLSGFAQPGIVLLNGGAVNAHWGVDTVTVPMPQGTPGQTFIVTIKPRGSDKALDAGSVTVAAPVVATVPGGSKPVPGAGSKPMPGGGGTPPAGGSGKPVPGGGGTVPPAGGEGTKPSVPPMAGTGTGSMGTGGTGTHQVLHPANVHQLAHLKPVFIARGSSQAAYTALLAEDLPGAARKAANSDPFGQAIQAYVYARQGNAGAAQPLIAATQNSSDVRTKAMALAAQAASQELSNPAQAAQLYDQAISTDPNLTVAYAAKAVLLYKNSPTPTERTAADAALKTGLAQAQSPNDKAAVYYAASKIYASTNRYAAAKKALSAARVSLPSLPKPAGMP